MMKLLVLVLAVAAGIQASPAYENRQERFVDDIVSAAIESVSNSIREAGLDPFELEQAEASYALPVPVLFNYNAGLRNLLVTGISDIVINNISFNLFSLKLTLDISLPKIYISVGEAAAEATVLGSKLSANVAGSITLTQPRVSGSVSVKIGLAGISVNTVDLELSIGNLFSLLDVNMLGKNVSPQVNDLLSNQILQRLSEYQNEINELINIVIKQVVNDQL